MFLCENNHTMRIQAILTSRLNMRGLENQMLKKAPNSSQFFKHFIVTYFLIQV